MNVIRQSNMDIISFLGGFQKEKKHYKYRFNKYCNFIKQSDRVSVIYNALTGGIVQIGESELKNINSETPFIQREHLIQNYYLVKEDFDEYQVVDNYRKHKKKFVKGNYLENPYSYVIMTTSDCNARCPYCYELGLKNKQPMSEEVMEKTIKYILDNTDPGQDVDIMFFGGEPLYNKDIIDNITTRLFGAERIVKTTIISNGYLFDDSLIEIAKNDWKVTSVQITLDGPEEVYNKTKKFIYKDENPFKKVIYNIHGLLNRGIDVSIRLNIGVHNISDMKELLNYLFEEFEGCENLTIYPWEIYQQIKPENYKTLYSGILELLDMIQDHGFQIKEDAENGIKTTHCMVDSGDSVLINEKGELGLCEHYVHDFMFSTLDHPEIKDYNVINSWFDYVKTDSDRCKECKIRPICLKMHKCTDQNVCDEYMQKYYIFRSNQNVITTVNKSENNGFYNCDCKCLQNKQE